MAKGSGFFGTGECTAGPETGIPQILQRQKDRLSKLQEKAQQQKELYHEYGEWEYHHIRKNDPVTEAWRDKDKETPVCSGRVEAEVGHSE